MNKNITTQFFLRLEPKDKTKKSVTLLESSDKNDIFEAYMRFCESNQKENYRIDKVTIQTETIAQSTDFRQSVFNF